MSTKEDVGAFLQALQEVQQKQQAALPEAEVKLDTPRERRFEQDIGRLFNEAWWISRTGAFPNGEPMRKQHPLLRHFWMTCMTALEMRQWGVKPEDPEAGEEARPA